MSGGDVEVRSAVRRAADGDADAWEWLYRRSHSRLLAFASRRLPASDAEDAVSETMTRAVQKIHSFTWRDGGFDAWLYGICRNVVHEDQRRRGRVRPTDDIRLPDATEVGPAEAALALDRRRALELAFARLGETDRELLELRVVGELSSDEVGAVVGKRPGAVRMAQARALERLRGHLEELGHA